METAALLPIQLQNPDETLLADLHALASRMIRQGHRPSSFLLLRLTDGRIKMVQSRGGSEQAREDLRRITNEYGPVGAAFRVWTEEEGGELVARVDNLTGSCEDIAEQTPAPSRNPLAIPYPCRDSPSRNSAILAGSLGMTTGLLPNVGSIFPAPGASNCPV